MTITVLQRNDRPELARNDERYFMGAQRRKKYLWTSTNTADRRYAKLRAFP